MKEKEVYYNGDDLGAVYHKTATDFRLWAPTADMAEVLLYATGDLDDRIGAYPMEKGEGGTWMVRIPGDLHRIYYTYRITRGQKKTESGDPYAKAVGVNGVRSMVVDLATTNPKGFTEDCGPTLQWPTDAVICEISIPDMTRDPSAGIRHRGKFLGLTERMTHSPEGNPTGIAYIKDLGVTHVQIMPMYDFGSVDESAPRRKQYNWGYDPVNYLVPEGSFSTDPFHGEVRIRELKKMIAAFHKEGIGVIMDVVFNHTYDVENSVFFRCEPGYFHREDQKGYGNGSGCGNEVASEHPMVRKYLVDSVKYWIREYHIDGFRFDLMGVIDMETMQEIAAELGQINPSILLYGEGWMGGCSLLPEQDRSVKDHTAKLNNYEELRIRKGLTEGETILPIGMFSDDLRDMVKGHVFTDTAQGFVNGQPSLQHAIRFAVAGCGFHPQVDYVDYAYKKPWALAPTQVVNYVACHDNLTLWDKLSVSCPEEEESVRLAMNRLAAAIVFTSMGIPFFLCGEDFARSKPKKDGTLSENSYNLPIEVNSLKYDRMTIYHELHEYYKGLIAFRKAHPALRAATSEEVIDGLRFWDTGEGVLAYHLQQDKDEVFVIHNVNPYPVELPLPEGIWKVCAEQAQAGTRVLRETQGYVVTEGRSSLLLCK